jgi:hypothetical protein
MSRKTGALATLAVSGLVTTLLTVAAPTQAAPGDSAACPTAFPAADLVVGETEATGLTTAGSYSRDGVEHLSQTTPEEFEGVYRGTVEDPSGDLFIFELSGSRITDSDGRIDAGIWAGISGSPLYAEDGSLIGSVSYTFAGYENSRYAGVTPATDLYDLLAPGTAAAPRKVALDAAERRTLQRQGVPAQATQSGLTRLAPVSTIGGVRGLPERAQKRIAKQAGVARPAAVAGTSTQDQVIDIVPGGNVAFAAAYGTLPMYSVGTAVAVCDDTVIGYGHQGNFVPASNTMHGASTQLVQPDAGSSYKLANLGAPVGAQTHDGLNGVLGELGDLPDSTEVVVNARGKKTTSTTNHDSDPDMLPYLTANQIVRDAVLSVDTYGAGSADVSWKIDYTRKSGRTGSLTGKQQYSSQYWVADYLYSDITGILQQLVDNRFEKLSIDKVTVDMNVRTTVNSASISKLEVKAGGKWKTAKRKQRVTLKPGQKVIARLTVAPTSYRSTAPTVRKQFTFKGDKKMRNASLWATGADMGDDYYYFEEYYEGGPGAATLDQLLTKLSKVTPSDRVTLTLRKGKGGKKPRVQKLHWRTGSPTSGWADGAVWFRK